MTESASQRWTLMLAQVLEAWLQHHLQHHLPHPLAPRVLIILPVGLSTGTQRTLCTVVVATLSCAVPSGRLTTVSAASARTCGPLLPLLRLRILAKAFAFYAISFYVIVPFLSFLPLCFWISDWIKFLVFTWTALDSFSSYVNLPSFFHLLPLSFMCSPFQVHA